ncbi:hypothetical protein V6N13_075796 [Hibiscus sabdariffa]
MFGDRILAPLKPYCVIASPRRFVHQNLSWVRSFTKHPHTRVHRLQWPFKVPVVERVYHCSRQYRCQINHHPLNPDVSVRSNQGRSLRVDETARRSNPDTDSPSYPPKRKGTCSS